MGIDKRTCIYPPLPCMLWKFDCKMSYCTISMSKQPTPTLTQLVQCWFSCNSTDQTDIRCPVQPHLFYQLSALLTYFFTCHCGLAVLLLLSVIISVYLRNTTTIKHNINRSDPLGQICLINS